MTEPNEVSEAWKDHREAQRERRAVRLPVRTAEIYALISQGKAQGVVKLTEYHFRIDGKLDLHPTHRRFHVLATGRRGAYESAAQIVGQVFGKPENKNA